MLTTLFTVFSGVTVYILGQLLMRFVLEPVSNFRELLAEIDHNLLIDANKLDEFYDIIMALQEASIDENRKNVLEDQKLHAKQRAFKYRDFAGKVKKNFYLIPCYDLLHKPFKLPRRTDIRDVMKELVGLSNTMLASKAPQVGSASDRKDIILEKICSPFPDY